MSTVLTAALLFKSSFVGAGLKREFTKARIFKIASIYGSFLRAGVIREAAVNTVDTVSIEQKKRNYCQSKIDAIFGSLSSSQSLITSF